MNCLQNKITECTLNNYAEASQYINSIKKKCKEGSLAVPEAVELLDNTMKSSSIFEEYYGRKRIRIIKSLYDCREIRAN